MPPTTVPSTGGVQRCDIYNTASVRGLIQNLDLNFEIENTSPTAADVLYLNCFSKLFEWVKIYLDNVEVMWMSGVEVAWLNQRRNMVLDSMDRNDFIEKFFSYGGGDSRQNLQYEQGVTASYDGTMRAGATLNSIRVQIPLDMLCSFLFHKYDTRNNQKISVELKYRNDSGNNGINSSFITGSVAAVTPTIYSHLNIKNSWITQRAMLYTDTKMFKPITELYTKPLIKTERQTIRLPAALTAGSVPTYNQTTPMTVKVRLADTFSIHKRIMAIAFTLDGVYPTGGAAPSKGGQCFQPVGMGARIYKGGKLVEDLSNFKKFARQSNHFYRCMGSKFLPISQVAGDYSGMAVADAIIAVNQTEIYTLGCLHKNFNLFQGIGGNMLSFLDRGLAETQHQDSSAMTKVQLIGGISNSVEENWEIEMDFYFDDQTYNKAGGGGSGAGWYEWTDKLNMNLLYTELLGVQPNPAGGPSSIKVFS